MNNLSPDQKINMIRDEINNTKEEVHRGIEKVIDRGERLDILVDRSNNLLEDAITFKKQSKRLKRKMLCKRIKIALGMIFILFIILMVALFMICGIKLQCGK